MQWIERINIRRYLLATILHVALIHFWSLISWKLVLTLYLLIFTAIFNQSVLAFMVFRTTKKGIEASQRSVSRGISLGLFFSLLFMLKLFIMVYPFWLLVNIKQVYLIIGFTHFILQLIIFVLSIKKYSTFSNQLDQK